MVCAAKADIFKCFWNLFHQHNIAKYVIIVIRTMQQLTRSWQHPQLTAGWLFPVAKALRNHCSVQTAAGLLFGSSLKKKQFKAAQSLGFLFYGIVISKTRFFHNLHLFLALAIAKTYNQSEQGIDSYPTLGEKIRELKYLTTVILLCCFPTYPSCFLVCVCFLILQMFCQLGNCIPCIQ